MNNKEINTTPKTKKHMGMSTKGKISNTIIYILLVVIVIIWILPFVCIFLESFRCETQGMAGYVIPKKWGFDNYVRLFTETNFLRWYGNTLLIAVCTAILQTVIVLAMSYTLSRLRFKGRKFLMNAMLVLGMFPGFLTLIVLYKVLSGMGLTGPGAVPGLILVYCASSGMGYYVSKGYFDTIPKSLDEAARVDGATRFQIFRKVIMPLAKPIVIVHGPLGRLYLREVHLACSQLGIQRGGRFVEHDREDIDRNVVYDVLRGRCSSSYSDYHTVHGTPEILC